MTKTRRTIMADLKLVDVVCEIIDARIPMSSRNPDINDICGAKPRLIILNKTDLADPGQTSLWASKFRREGFAVIQTDCKTGKGIKDFSTAVKALLKEKLERNAAKGQAGRGINAMIVGIPNVGKSAFINRLAGRKTSQTGDRPGVTRGKQWVNVDSSLLLLDTPGILWPKFDDEETAIKLACTGAVKDEITDVETLSYKLMELLAGSYPQSLIERYKLDIPLNAPGYELLENAARKRGFLLSGGELDTLRMSNILLDEFRGGRLGKITLDRYKEDEPDDRFMGAG